MARHELVQPFDGLRDVDDRRWRRRDRQRLAAMRRGVAAGLWVRSLGWAPMPLQNRVTPLGELVADPARGLVYGNRGCLHDAEGHIQRAYQVRRWIACRLEFRGRRRSPLQRPGRFTELFFLDEATALAAGHRPCAECRRADYDRFSAIWRGVHDESGADVIDARLHDERIDPAARARRLYAVAYHRLPDGVFVLHEGAPKLVLGDVRRR